MNAGIRREERRLKSDGGKLIVYKGLVERVEHWEQWRVGSWE